MKDNSYRKLYPMDKFAKRYYCKHAKRNQIRSDKKILNSKIRASGKRQILEETYTCQTEKTKKSLELP